MKYKKGTTGADYFAFVIIGIGGTFIIMFFVLFVFIPSMEGRTKYKIETEMADVQSNLFLLYYLDYPVGNKSIADIISYSYANDDYGELRAETMNILKELYGGEVGWKILINDEKVVEQCNNPRCKGRSRVYGTTLPFMIPDTIINFKIRIYET